MLNQIINTDLKLESIEEIKRLNSNTNLNVYKYPLKDLSYLKTYTIDDVDSLEIDDAISLERINNYYKLWIHIASPVAYIEYNSAVDKCARKLISTTYLSNNIIYMFPEVLINQLFSITNKEKRASLSMGVIFNNDGSVSSFEIVQSLIKSNYQLSYDDADELIEYAPKEEEDLSIISKLLETRKNLRKKSGAKEILESYGKIIVKDNIPNIKVIDQTISRILISEAMILYGDLIANYTKTNNIPVPYRVQECKTRASNNQKINSDNQILYNFLLKKSMGKTFYSVQPLIHYSLGLDCYLQATSPIRRYSDLLVHYQISRFLNDKTLISKEEIEKNIIIINNIGRQNINRYREDQKSCLNKWFMNNTTKKYKVVLLNWINRCKNISIVYFTEYNISSICHLRAKIEINIGDVIIINNITHDYNDMLYFEMNS